MTLLDEINDLINEIEQTFREIEAAVNDAISAIPWLLGWMADGIRSAWNGVCDKIAEFWAYLDETVGNEIGNPEALSYTADRWTNDVGGPVSGQVAVAEAANLDADNAWQGDAAEAYRDRLSLHKGALTAVQATLTNGIAGALDKVQGALEVYFGAIISALVTLIGVLIFAIVSIAGGPTVVAGLVAVGVGILAAIAAIGLARLYLESQCRSAKTAMELVVSSSGAFGEDHWPAGAVS